MFKAEFFCESTSNVLKFYLAGYTFHYLLQFDNKKSQNKYT